MNTTELNLQTNNNISENEGGMKVESSSEVSLNNARSFANISFFILTHKYTTGLNLNQKRTLRKAATNFSLIGKLSFDELNFVRIFCFK